MSLIRRGGKPVSNCCGAAVKLVTISENLDVDETNSFNACCSCKKRCEIEFNRSEYIKNHELLEK